MLRDDVIVHQDIASLPFVQDADLVRDFSQPRKIVFGNGSAIAVALLRDVLPAAVGGDLEVLVVRRKAGEQSRQIRLWLCADRRR